MASLNLKSLVGKLNASCRRALEGSAGLCLSRTNYNVEVEHWLMKLLEPADGDLPRILRHYEIDPARLNRELTKVLDGLKTGNARAPELSPEIVDLMREAGNASRLSPERRNTSYTAGARSRSTSPRSACSSMIGRIPSSTASTSMVVAVAAMVPLLTGHALPRPPGQCLARTPRR